MTTFPFLLPNYTSGKRKFIKNVFHFELGVPRKGKSKTPKLLDPVRSNSVVLLS